MNKKKAIKLAIQSMKKEIQRLAVDGNLHDIYGADYPCAITSSKRRKELKEAIEILEGEYK